MRSKVKDPCYIETFIVDNWKNEIVLENRKNHLALSYSEYVGCIRRSVS